MNVLEINQANDYAKLLGRMREKKINQADLADKIGVSSVTLSLKLNNKACFRQSEIIAICSVLDISSDRIGMYFFNSKV